MSALSGPIRRLTLSPVCGDGPEPYDKRGFGPSRLTRERTDIFGSLVLFDRGDAVTVQASEEEIQFLLVSGKPLREPIAWYGPIVMNTQAELQQAVRELRDGTFIKSG